MTDRYYIHIPFCRQRCPYCKFALTPIFDEFKKQRYIEYLKKEIREYFSEQNPPSPLRYNSLLKVQTQNLSQGGIETMRTIYFGGGTPSVLSHDETREILECFPFYDRHEQGKISHRPQIQDSVEITETQELYTEITMEMNPEDVTHEYITGVLALGINRISLGVQTLNEASLKEIHRSDRNTIFGALESISSILSSRGTRDLPEKADSSYRQNDNKVYPVDKRDKISLNIDFILGLPFVKPGETLAGIRELHNHFPHITHTSVYMLEDEKYPNHWKANSISEIELQKEFLAIIEYFESLGWDHYELSNWAKPGYQSIHNRGYWDHSNSRGFGLSAASYENGVRWSNLSSFSGYYDGKKDNEEILTLEQREIENMMFSLRTNGWSTPLIRGDGDSQGGFVSENTEQAPLPPLIGGPKTIKKLDTLISDGLLEKRENKIKLTKTGIFVLDHILSELISDS